MTGYQVYGKVFKLWVSGGRPCATDKEKARLCGPGLPVMAGAQAETGCILRNVELLSKDCANRGKAWQIPRAQALTPTPAPRCF
jgi:hypothetical protein